VLFEDYLLETAEAILFLWTKPRLLLDDGKTEAS